MLKTKFLYRWSPDNTGLEVLDVFKKSTIEKVDRNGIIFFIQVISSKPLDYFNGKEI